jgi:hypothetical protein
LRFCHESENDSSETYEERKTIAPKSEQFNKRKSSINTAKRQRMKKKKKKKHKSKIERKKTTTYTTDES